MSHFREFSKEDNIQYWVILFLAKDPLVEEVHHLPEFKKIHEEVESNFWRNHKKSKRSWRKMDFDEKMKLHNFYLNKTEPNKSCLLALRSIILAQDNLITETQKYGMPCFCKRKRAFCYLWIDKKNKEPYLLMVEGKSLNHPALETGGRSRMKILRIDPNQDLPLSMIVDILQKALDLYRKP